MRLYYEIIFALLCVEKFLLAQTGFTDLFMNLFKGSASLTGILNPYR